MTGQEKVAAPPAVSQLAQNTHEAPETMDRSQDIAMAVVGDQAQDFSSAVEARVIRKIDYFLIPAMIVGYGLVYYDKVSP